MEQAQEGTTPIKKTPAPTPPPPRPAEQASEQNSTAKKLLVAADRPAPPPPPPIRGLPNPAVTKPGPALVPPPTPVPIEQTPTVAPTPARPAAASAAVPAPRSTPNASPSPPAVKASSPLRQTQPDSEEIEIRTMQDDLRDIQKGIAPPKVSTESATFSTAHGQPPVAPSPGRPASLKQGIGASAGQPASLTRPTAAAAAATAFPLPPKAAHSKQKVVLAPTVTRRRHHGWLWVTLFLLVLGGGAGAAGWYWYSGNSLPLVSPPPTTQRASASAVLPAESVATLQYYIPSSEERTVLAPAWRAASVEPTLAMVLDGDPRLLFADPDLREFFYVILEGTSRPYLVVPKTAYTTQLFSDGAASTSEREGWYIAHALAVAPYEAALAAGPLTDPELMRLFTTPEATSPLRLSLGPVAVTQLRQALGGNPFAIGAVTSLQLKGTYDAVRHTLTWEGTAQAAAAPGATNLAPDILQLLPPGFSAARAGANFNQDMQQWLTAAPNGAGDIVGQPAARQFIASLATPYVLYVQAASGSVESLGLVVTLPPELQRTSTLQEPVLPQIMPALLSIILDQRTVAPVTFSDGEYAGIPLRYANIVGTSKALDYALTDTHLLIATSKDGMLQLLDTVAGTTPAAPASEPWARLLTPPPAAKDNLLLGTLPATAGITQLLVPTAPGSTSVNAARAGFLLTVTAEASGIHARVLVALPQ